MAKAFFKAGLVVWAARIATLVLLYHAPWSMRGKIVLFLCVALLDFVLSARAGRLEQASRTMASWRAAGHGAVMPCATEVAEIRPNFEVPTRFENDPAPSEARSSSAI